MDLSPPGRDHAEWLLDLGAALWSVGEIEASDAAHATADLWLAEYPDEGLAHRRAIAKAWQSADSGGAGSFEDIRIVSQDAYEFTNAKATDWA